MTIQGGNLTAEFTIGGRTICPHYVFPWWNEPISLELDNLTQGMRGDFFCFPFGMDTGDPPAYHGPTAGGIWQPVNGDSGDGRMLDLRVDLGDGMVVKHVELRSGQTVIYQRHTVTGFDGQMPFGYHPILQFPDSPGSGLISFSAPTHAFTPPEPVETCDTGGYSCLKPGIAIEDQASVPCVDGTTLNLLAYPHEHAHEDIALLVSDSTLDFVWSAVSFPEQRYLYFQLKDPRILRQTMLWMSNGGRWYSPWNGRIAGVLGLEEITGFFHYGEAASTGRNFLSDQGIPTSRLFESEQSVDIPLVSGIASIGSEFGSAVSIDRAGDGHISITGQSGEEVRIPCDVGFLESSSDARKRV